MRMNFLKLGFILALAGGLLFACTEKPGPEQPQETPETVFPKPGTTVDGLVLSASLPDAQTKTTLSTDGNYDVLWKTGDKISVNGTLSEPVASGDNGKEVVDFTVNGSLTAPFNVL